MHCFAPLYTYTRSPFATADPENALLCTPRHRHTQPVRHCRPRKMLCFAPLDTDTRTPFPTPDPENCFALHPPTQTHAARSPLPTPKNALHCTPRHRHTSRPPVPTPKMLCFAPLNTHTRSPPATADPENT